jgi:GMP synthase (glutamine-hydrolysing)
LSVLRLLVADGNNATNRRRVADVAGMTPGESYAKVLQSLAPEALVDICTPADADAAIRAPLEVYNGVVFTGSALNTYKREPESLRQIAFMRELFARGASVFGSCWGLQVAAVAAGGEVGPNPRGREVAFARKLTLTAAGRSHQMHRGRPTVFDAPAIHADEIVTLPPKTIVTACNEVSTAQAAEIRFSAGVFWGVQYHPEYDFHDVATTILRYGQRLVDENFFQDMSELDRYAADLAELHADPTRRDIALRLGLGDDILDPQKRRCEISNWIAREANPFRATAKHGRPR